MITVLTTWTIASSIALTGSVLVLFGSKMPKGAKSGLFRALLATFFGSGLMIEYIVGTMHHNVYHVGQHVMSYDTPILFASWAGLALGPVALADSLRVASPRQAPFRVNVLRALSGLAWGLSSFATVMDIVSI
jgi:hypothetical protein